jgi:membrane protease YdiL (CAAX protease family)
LERNGLMKNIKDQSREPSSGIVGIWQRIPLLFRATFLGVLVSSVGVYSWLIIGALVPAYWSLVIMVIVLWLYTKYFSGSWWPTSTAGARQINFRTTKLTADIWKWGLLSALLIVAIWQSGIVLTFRIIEFPGDVLTSGYDLTGLPLWIAWLMIIMSSMVAGICEETGYRGYMQVPLENRYGPGASIVLVSILFLVIHLQQVWAPPLLLHLFGLSVLLGILAYASGSIIPSIVAHFSLDIINFSYWWTDLAGRYTQRPIVETGVDAHFLAWGLFFIVSLGLFFWAIRKIMRFGPQRL